ncbi:hypothetical protein COU76_01835 [Candidatus Peregrinibacteria bacterium CG10_big_fil_rev_8_21_14_0_10_49_10]|nr:MAG: hypothetical protein COU76_01835 [Candidatus Peregrinibacteria bacterium CG10_big_fil_rev_8_21_14_0_10_49_10]
MKCSRTKTGILHYRALLLLGLFCGCGVPIAHAQNASLYNRMHAMTLQENAENVSEKTLETFIAKIYPRENLPLFEAADVDKALQSRSGEVCRTEDPAKKQISEGSCAGYLNEVEQLVLKNARLRQFVRNLQIAAAGFETGMSSYSGQRTDIVTKLPSIAHMWQSDTDAIQSPIIEGKVRGAVYPAASDPTFTALSALLSGLKEGDSSGNLNAKEDREVFVGAVWRYRNGFAQFWTTESDRNSPPLCTTSRNALGDGTELQYLGARFCDIEKQLHTIYLSIQNNVVYTPPLKPGEIVLFPAKKLVTGTGKDIGVSVWATNADVGLLWNFHLEPVLPSLDCSGTRSYAQTEGICEEDAILGGTYPAVLREPAEGTGFCAQPFAKRGYLCRRMEAASCESEANAGTGPEDIRLFTCDTPKMAGGNRWIRWTESGPNICGEGGWSQTPNPAATTDTAGEDIAMVRDQCSNCFVDTVCEPCGTPDGSLTHAKEESGRIEVCLNPAVPAMSTYVYIHEMVHAQQLCDSPYGNGQTMINTIKKNPEGCCAYEYPAALAQCNAMAEDGLLTNVVRRDANNAVVETIGQVDITTCAGMVTNFHCGTQGSFDEACVDFPGTMDQTRVNQIWTAVEKNVQEKSSFLGIAQSCPSAVVEKLDARVQKQKNSLRQVCSPTCETSYINTIGNNACMIGQCLEESLESHRLIPGRMPLNTQEEAFPWDSNAANDPNYGSFMFTSPKLSLPIPSYRPALLARQMDTMLCQVNGFPTRTPPFLCAFNPLRRLRLPTKTYLPFAQSLLNQPEEQDSAYRLLRQVAPAVGSRVGTELYRQYLGPALGVFEELMHSASDLLQNMEDVTFPDQMCKRNAYDSL